MLKNILYCTVSDVRYYSSYYNLLYYIVIIVIPVTKNNISHSLCLYNNVCIIGAASRRYKEYTHDVCHIIILCTAYRDFIQ